MEHNFKLVWSQKASLGKWSLSKNLEQIPDWRWFLLQRTIAKVLRCECMWSVEGQESHCGWNTVSRERIRRWSWRDEGQGPLGQCKDSSFFSQWNSVLYTSDTHRYLQQFTFCTNQPAYVLHMLFRYVVLLPWLSASFVLEIAKLKMVFACT